MRFLGVSIAFLLLSGCGLKGDLYRPPSKPAAEPSATQAPAAGTPAEEDAKDENGAKPAPKSP